ncbi:MAG: radical SAM protein, partial [Clostridia bacterium]|nr:radical SAM protein [Clostridia bacterium]
MDRAKTIATYTLGCKVNQYDTEAMLERFEAAGYRAVGFQDAADVYLINTCTVTGTGDQKSLRTIRRVAREHPQCAIVVCGCLAQREAEQIRDMDNVALVVGVQRRGEVVELLERALATGETISAVAPLKGAGFESLSVSRHEGKTRATMKIQEGCDRYCSYCVIPSVRGPVRSMPLPDVAAEAARLAAAGYREIVVTGIHLASYGRGTAHTLLDALRAVPDAPGVRRVRIGSLEPVTVPDDVARASAEMPWL